MRAAACAHPTVPRVARAAAPAVSRASRVVLVRGINVGTSKQAEDLGGLGGDIGARDATAGEIESGFTSKVLGHADTDHILQVPTEMADMVKVVNKSCAAEGAYAEKLDFQGQEVLRKQVWDWKIRPGRANFECLRREFSLKDGEAANFVALVEGVCAREGWPAATAEATSESAALVELGTEAVKGMTTNDFILAAKIDACEEAMALVVKDAPKKRNWF